jgi:hypothetical protein
MLGAAIGEEEAPPMGATPLRCRDLAAGDILLKASDGSAVSKAIQLGQSVMGGKNAGVVHAGVMFDKTCVIEAQGGGILAHDLRVQNRDYGYYVFRCAQVNMARGAGTCAKMMFDIHNRGGNLGYSLGGAIGSLFGGKGNAASRDEMDALLDRILDGKNQRFFCSQFVVYVYQFVAEQCGVAAQTVFKMSDAKANPSVLAASLAGRALFKEQGYLMPRER